MTSYQPIHERYAYLVALFASIYVAYLVHLALAV